MLAVWVIIEAENTMSIISFRRPYIAPRWQNYAAEKGCLARFSTVCPIWLAMLSVRFLFREWIAAGPRSSGSILHVTDLFEGMWVIVGTEIISRDVAGLAERGVGISRSESDLNPAGYCRDKTNTILKSAVDRHCEARDW
jgi:hypothetical protein